MDNPSLNSHLINYLKPIQHYHVNIRRINVESSELVVEKPFNLMLNGETWITFLCTPIDLEALAVGYLYNESIIDSLKSIKSVVINSTESCIDIWLDRQIKKPTSWYKTSGCSGGWSIQYQNALADCSSNQGIWMTEVDIYTLVFSFYEAQLLYPISGGVHTSALADGKQIILACEDIGRHNTLDKITGKILLSGLIIQKKILITTGRISSEMIMKAARIGAAIVISRTAPTSLSVDLASEIGITLIGYARKSQFNIYTNAQRILINSDISNTNP